MKRIFLKIIISKKKATSIICIVFDISNNFLLKIGLVIDVKSINTPLQDSELFDDSPFWHLPDDAVGNAYQPNDDLVLEQNKKQDQNSDHDFNVNKVYPEWTWFLKIVKHINVN